MNPRDRPATFENPYFSSSKKQVEINTPLNQPPGTKANQLAGVYKKNTVIVPGYAADYKQLGAGSFNSGLLANAQEVRTTNIILSNNTNAPAPTTIYRGTSNQDVVGAGNQLVGTQPRFTSTDKNIRDLGSARENKIASGEVANQNQNQNRNVGYAEKVNLEQAERPQYKKIYTNENQRVSSRTKNNKNEDEKCPFALLALLGLLGVAGIVLGTLFGIGIIGGLNGPLAQANLQASTNLPATTQPTVDGKPVVPVAPSKDGAEKTTNQTKTIPNISTTPSEAGPQKTDNTAGKQVPAPQNATKNVVVPVPTTVVQNGTTANQTTPQKPTPSPITITTTATTTLADGSTSKAPPAGTTALPTNTAVIPTTNKSQPAPATPSVNNAAAQNLTAVTESALDLISAMVTTPKAVFPDNDTFEQGESVVYNQTTPSNQSLAPNTAVATLKTANQTTPSASTPSATTTTTTATKPNITSNVTLKSSAANTTTVTVEPKVVAPVAGNTTKPHNTSFAFPPTLVEPILHEGAGANIPTTTVER